MGGAVRTRWCAHPLSAPLVEWCAPLVADPLVGLAVSFRALRFALTASAARRDQADDKGGPESVSAIPTG